MKEIIIQNKEIIYSFLTIIILLILRLIINKTIRKIGKINVYKNDRTQLIIRYFNILMLLLAFIVLSFIWCIDFRNLGLFFSSVFAVIGIALFAQWSIISNITSGVILFFAFPFKIGDKIRIQDKDFPLDATIEDIRAFNVNLRTDEGELVTYPTSLFLQKAVTVLNPDNQDDGSESV